MFKRKWNIYLLLVLLILSGCEKNEKPEEETTKKQKETVDEENDFLAIIQKDFPFAGGSIADGVEPEGVNGEEIEVAEGTHTDIFTDSPKASKYMLPVRCVMQNPELPTGCEATSLTIVLNYLGYTVDKMEIVNNYLTKGKIGTVTAWQAFIGDPTSPNLGFGCYSTVLKQCADKYLAENNSPYKSYNITGTGFDSLLAEVEKGSPVIIWATIDMVKPYYANSWQIDGEEYRWLADEHCLVLTGFDRDSNICYVADPLKGNVTYSYDILKARYSDMFSQALVIK